jgi:hypothetical protein
VHGVDSWIDRLKRATSHKIQNAISTNNLPNTSSARPHDDAIRAVNFPRRPFFIVMRPPAGLAQALAPIDRHMNSGEKPDAWAAFLDSGKGQAFGVIAGHLPSAILILPKPVSRSPPETSSIYLSSISRALCSAGMRCIKPLAPSRNETNSSRVNAGGDKT